MRGAADFQTNAVPLLARYLENERLLPRISKRVHKWDLTVYEELEIATCSGPFQETGRDFKRVGFDNKKKLRTAFVTISQSLLFVSVGHTVWTEGLKMTLVNTTQWNKPPLSLSQTLRRGLYTNSINTVIAAVRERG